MSAPLNKTLFLAGLQCPLRQFWLFHGSPLDSPADNEESLAIRYGRETGHAARLRFPGGALVDTESTRAAAIQRTRDLMAAPSVPAIFEAAFEHDGVFVRVDILERDGGAWRLIEVKSSVNVSDRHASDIAIQRWVLEGCGVPLSAVCLMRPDRNYVREDDLNLDALFTLEDYTEATSLLLEEIPAELALQRETLTREDAPAVATGPHCTKPACEFQSVCLPELPDDHINTLPSLHASKRAKLTSLGVSRLSEIPENFRLTELQKRVRDVTISGAPFFSALLREELAGVSYPLWFVDFETIAPPVPRYHAMRPWQQIPVQWSAHCIAEPGAEVRHFEFLASPGGDPRKPFAETLVTTLTGDGHIVVYNAAFEGGRIDDLGEWFPALAPALAGLRSRLWDLHPAVRKHVYHPDFRGSFSIKKVLPALVTGLSYDGLEIGRGDAASLAWDRLMRDEIPEPQRTETLNHLRAYCELDTLAMVRIFETLRLRTSAIAAPRMRDPLS